MLAGDPYDLARIDHTVARFQSVNTQGRLGGRMALPLLARCDRRLLRRFNKERELLRLSWLLRMRLAGSAPVASRARICRGRAMDTSRHTSTALHANKPAGERRCRGRALPFYPPFLRFWPERGSCRRRSVRKYSIARTLSGGWLRSTPWIAS